MIRCVDRPKEGHHTVINILEHNLIEGFIMEGIVSNFVIEMGIIEVGKLIKEVIGNLVIDKGRKVIA